MPRRRGRSSNADSAAARAVNSNAVAGGATDNTTGSNTGEAGALQASIKIEPSAGSFDISALNPGFTAPVDGPQEAGPNSTVEPTTGETVRKRGRPPGSTNRKPISASGVETLLLGIHSTLHAVFKIEELALDREEAKQLASAYADVSEHYPMLNFDPKYAALANFAGVVSIVYGSKIVSWRLRRSLSPRRSGPLEMPNPVAQRPQQTPQPSSASFMSPEINGVDPNAASNRRDVPPEARKSVIPGIGTIEFPPDHPLINGKPN